MHIPTLRLLPFVGVLTLLFTLWLPQTVLADGVITNCTNITELQETLKLGGTVTFNCSGGETSIPVSGASISVDSATVTDQVIIDGAGSMTFEGDGATRLWNVQQGKTLILRGVTLNNGQHSSSGGGIRVNGATLILEDSTVQNSTAPSGGGIFVTNGNFTARNVVIQNNQATSVGGGIYLQNSSAITLSQVTVSTNTSAGDGGGIGSFIASGNTASVVISNSTIISNTASNHGGGVHLRKGNTADYSVLIQRSAVVSNTAQDGIGGGLQNGNPSSGSATQGATVTLANVTFSANQANGSGSAGKGGGVSTNGGTTALLNVTVADNTATQGGGVYRVSGGVISLTNSLVAENTAVTGPDCANSPTSLGNNLFSSVDGCTLTTQTSDLVTTTVGLFPLTNNGGDSQSHAINVSSPANDAANSTTCQAVPVSGVDQRGQARELSQCDIGAYEFDASAVTEQVVTDCSNETQLASYLATGAANITFNCLIGTNTIPVANEMIVSPYPIIINGGGVINLQGDGTTRLFRVESGQSLSLQQITLSNGQAGANLGGAIRVNVGTVEISDSTITNHQAASGGAFLVRTGVMTLSNSTLSNNTATSGAGGAIQIDNSSQVTVFNSTISGNQSQSNNGGAVTLVGGTDVVNRLALSQTKFTSNTAANSGGAIYVDESSNGQTTLAMTQTTFSQSVATASDGGAIHLNSRNTSQINMQIVRVQFSNNRADATSGGAISFNAINTSEVTADIYETTLDSNQAQDNGGGVYLRRAGGGGFLDLTLRHSTVSNNIAVAGDGGGLQSEGAGTSLARLYLINSTVSANRAPSTSNPNGDGGGLNIGKSASGMQAWLTNTTVYSNYAGRFGGGIRTESDGQATLHNTILAGNSSGFGIVDCSNNATMISNGHNFIGDETECESIFTSGNNDQVGTTATPLDPQLGALADNGGQTQTHAVSFGSPVQSGANGTTCLAPPINGVDQRGEPRASSFCAIGAYQLVAYSLDVAQTLSTATAAPSGTVNSTIRYTVTGITSAPNVTIRNIPLAQATLVDYTSTGTLVGGNIVWSLGTLLANTGLSQQVTGELTATYQLNRPLANGLGLTTTTRMATSEGLIVSDTDGVTVAATLDLQLAKTASSDNIGASEPLTYTIVYTVSGDSTVSDVTVSDALPQGVTYLSASPTPNSEPTVGTRGIVSWSLGDLISTNNPVQSASGSLQIVAQTDPSLPSGQTTILNTVQITSTEQPVSSTASVSTLFLVAQLSVSQQSTSGVRYPNQVATYTIVIANNGNTATSNLILTDTLPTSVTYRSSSVVESSGVVRTNPIDPNRGDTQPVWGSWMLPAGGQITLTLAVDLASGLSAGVYDNALSVTSDESSVVDDGSSGTNDDLTVLETPNVTLNKTTLTPQTEAGTTASYQIVINNPSQTTLTNVSLNDLLPVPFSYLRTDSITTVGNVSRTNSVTPTVGSFDLTWGTWSIGGGGVLTLAFTVDVPRSAPATVYDNSVTMFSEETLTVSDAGTSSTDEDVIVVRTSELQINKRTTTPVVVAGEVATYTIALLNSGSEEVTRVVITDILPTGFTYRSHTETVISGTRLVAINPIQGDSQPVWGLWQLDSGGMLTLTVAADVASDTPASTYNNLAQADGQEISPIEDDPTLGGDADTISGDTAGDEDVIVGVQPKLELTVRTDRTVVPVSGQVSYQLKVRNVGTANAEQVRLSHLLPTTLTYQAEQGITTTNATRISTEAPISATNGPNWGVWTVGIGGEVTINYLAQVAADSPTKTYTTTVTATSSNALTVTTAQTLTTEFTPILQINKTTSTPNVAAGGIASYQIVVANVGNLPATQVVITDLLPAGGFAFRETVSINQRNASRTNTVEPLVGQNTPVWQGWTIDSGGAITINFTADVFNQARPGTYNNEVQANSAELTFVDDLPNTADESDTFNDQLNDEAVTIILQPLLRIDKDALAQTVNGGELISYRIRVVNNGAIQASNVVITDLLPSGFSYQATISESVTSAIRTNPVDPALGATTPVWSGWTILSGGEVQLIFTALTPLSNMTAYNTAQTQAEGLNVATDAGQTADDADAILGQDTAGDAEVTVIYQRVELQMAYLPILIKPAQTIATPIPTASPTPSPTVIGNPTATPTNTPIPTATPTSVTTRGPDLVIQRIESSANLVQVVITNQGDQPVTDEFWVDFYVNPNPPPSAPNEVWNYQNRAEEGIVWGVTASALPLDPGELLILTYRPGGNDRFVARGLTQYSGNLSVGTAIYVQVDSADSTTNFGAVLESHEISGGPYNNISNGVIQTAVQVLSQPTARQDAPLDMSGLPAR